MNTVKLRGITWDHPRGYNPLVAASDVYAKENDIIVEWNKRSLKDFGDQSLEQLAAQFDLLIIDHPHSGVAAASGCILPLEQHVDSSTFQTLRAQSAGPSFDSYNYQGHQWALPIDAAFQSASYRPDLINNPLPESWKDFFDLCDAAKSQGKYIGMALCPTDSLCTFLSLTAQLGSPIREENGLLIEENKGVEVLGLMRRIHKHAHPESIHWNPIQLYDYMAEQNDMIYSPLAFNYTNYSRADFRTNKLCFANPPGTIAVLGGAGLAVSAACQYPTEAAKYAAWICGADVQKGLYTMHEGQSGNIKAWEDEQTNEITDGFFRRTMSTLSSAYVRPRFLGWPAFQEKLGDIVNDFLTNALDPKVVLKELQVQYERSRRG